MTRNGMSFEGKVVLVTGASSGIGAAISIKFAEQGAQVSLVGRNQERLNEIAEKCGKSLVIKADISMDEDAKRIVNETIEYFGRLDVLVNNAGIASTVPITEEHALENFDKIMATNIRAPVLITNVAAPHLIKTKGNIINISSIAGTRVYEGFFAYSTSKAALDQFTRCIALDLASGGVRANTVSPGPVRTNVLENSASTGGKVKFTYEVMQNNSALKRISEPEEVADLVLFLAHDKAKAITGATYLTDNGTLLI